MRLVALAMGALALAIAPRAFAMSIHEVPNPRARGSWIADTNDMIDAATEARLDRTIDAFEKERGVEIAVVCVERVDAPTPKDFATQLFDLWGIGKAGKDDGLLVLMVRGERRLEMETGYGLEPVLTDGWLKLMQQDEMVPFFKAGDYGSGIEAGVRASIARLRLYPDGVPPGVDPPRRAAGGGHSARATPSQPTDWTTPLLFGGAIVALGGGLGMHLHRRDRTCPHCKVRMKMVPEDEDDMMLERGQRTEERLGTVDHQLFRCEPCDFDRHIRVEKWFSGHVRCDHCLYKAAVRTSATIVPATQYQSGTREVAVTCKHCHRSVVTQETIPMLPQASSSSSSSSSWSSGSSSFGSSGSSFGSSGSSFGGGSSGGGGAGSSW